MMKEKLILPLLISLFILGFALVFTVTIKGEHLSFLEGEAVAISSKQIPQPQPTLSQSILSKILESDPDFDNINLAVGDHDISYFDERFLKDSNGNFTFDNNGQPRIEKVPRNDPEREIALKLLDLNTGETKIVKVKKSGQDLIAPPGYDIEVVQRPSGIRWNAHNTFYNVKQPANMIVIKNVWPQVKYVSQKRVVVVKGKKKTQTVQVPVFDVNKTYVPYSDALKSDEIVQKGINDLKLTISRAKDQLRANQVMSRSFPDRLVADVLPDDYYWRRPIIEQSDFGEFVLNPKGTIERFFVILATNGSDAWSSCNFADACGILQFTGKTYKTVVKTYPSAHLIQDFKIGSFDHINVSMAAILLDDMNLSSLVNRYGNRIYNNSRLEEYLAASYNGAPKHVFNSLNATMGRTVNEWGVKLKRETKEFMVKLRYLTDNAIPS